MAQIDEILAPHVGGAGTRAPQRITGSTSSVAFSTQLESGKYATLKNSADTPIAVRWGSSSPTAEVTDVELGTGESFRWAVDTESSFVACIAADGTSTFEAWLWTSST